MVKMANIVIYIYHNKKKTYQGIIDKTECQFVHWYRVPSSSGPPEHQLLITLTGLQTYLFCHPVHSILRTHILLSWLCPGIPAASEAWLGAIEDTNAWGMPVAQHRTRPWVPAFPICFIAFPSEVSLVPARHSDPFSIHPDPFGFSNSAWHLAHARVSFLYMLPVSSQSLPSSWGHSLLVTTLWEMRAEATIIHFLETLASCISLSPHLLPLPAAQSIPQQRGLLYVFPSEPTLVNCLRLGAHQPLMSHCTSLLCSLSPVVCAPPDLSPTGC